MAATGLARPLKAVPETVVLNLSQDNGTRGALPGAAPWVSHGDNDVAGLPVVTMPGPSKPLLLKECNRRLDEDGPLKTMIRDDTSSTTATLSPSLLSVHSQSRTSGFGNAWGKPSTDPSSASLATATTTSSPGIGVETAGAACGMESVSALGAAYPMAGTECAIAAGAPSDGMLVGDFASASVPSMDVGELPPEPPGHGSLYKCAICGVLVYESQLDHHVLICPDPSDGAAQQPSRDCGVPDTIDEIEHSSPPTPVQMQDQGETNDVENEPTVVASQAALELPSSQLPDAGEQDLGVAEDESRIRRGWTYEESDLSVHHEAQNQRASKRRSLLAEELRRKHEEECTFAPKILRRGSPRVISRSLETSAGKRSVTRVDEQHRTNKLKQVEAQVYADVTLRPQISRFARVWSQRQNEAMASDGLAPQSVFDRLYSTGVQTRIAREAAAEAIGEGAGLTGNSTPSNVSLGGVSGDGSSAMQIPSKPLGRRIPTTELLYSDALDRRERLRALSLQLEGQREEPRVLGRSRRYYWQMLERQIKSAFDTAAAGENVLTFSKLEDFLVHFGCVRPPQRGPAAKGNQAGNSISPNGGSGEALHEKEAARLRQSLWRHLDPLNTGQVDLLSVTVFFHVLMGAVDDAAKASHGLCTAGTVGAGNETAGASAPARTMPAISEEDGGCAIIPPECDVAFSGGPPGAPCGDDDGRRIVELLVRFDPTRLRSEFQSLYTHRLHYQAQQQGANGSSATPSSKDAAERPVQKPEIDIKSRLLADRAAERHRTETGSQASRVDILLMRKQQSELKLEEKRRAAQAHEISGCTFRPRTKTQPAEMHSQATPRGTNRNEVLYNRGLSDKARRDAHFAEEAAARAEAEVAHCTFQPNTKKSVKSFSKHAQDGSPPVPRGYYENRQRIRAATEAERQKRSQREDRMAKVTPIADAAALASGQRAPVSSASNRRCNDAAALPSSSKFNTIVDTPRDLGGQLPPVAEERELRRAPNTSRTHGRQESSSPAPRGRPLSQPPRDSSTNRSTSATDSRHLTGGSTSRSRSANKAMHTDGHTRQSFVGDGPDVSERHSDSLEDSRPLTHRSTASSQENSPPVVYVDVNIAPGQPPERIVIREGQSINDVAEEFAAKHSLAPVLTQRLHALLQEVMQRQDHCPQEGWPQH